MAVICGVPVSPYVPGGLNTAVGVLKGADGDIYDDDLMEKIFSRKEVIQARGVGRPIAQRLPCLWTLFQRMSKLD